MPSSTFNRLFFSLFFLLFFLFPSDHGFREIGIGSEGMRILLPDIFCLLLILISLTNVKEVEIPSNKKFLISFLLFIILSIFSLLRGLQLNKGLAIGDARWFLSAVFIFIAYAFYNKRLSNVLYLVILLAACFHSLTYLYNFLNGNAWDSSGDVERYGGGRESLIIVFGILILYVNTLSYINHFIRYSLIILFVTALFIGQTRTIFLQVPFMLLIVGWLFKKVNIKNILIKTLYFSLSLYICFYFFTLIAPSDIVASIQASSSVLLEAFDLQTFNLIFNPHEALNKENWSLFSSSGNTLFRVLAWAQTLDDILSTKNAIIWGLPMGRNYEWIGPGGILNENMQPHNDYLVILSRVGMIGLIAYLLMVGYVFKRLRGAINAGLSTNHLFLLTCFFIMTLFFVGLNAEIRSYGMHFWVWFLMGFIIKEIKLAENAINK